MVKEDEERPVNEPRALLEGLQRGRGHVALDELLEPIQIFKRVLPVLRQDLRGELPPQAVQEVLSEERNDDNDER